VKSGHYLNYTLPVSERATVLGELLELVTHYGGQHPRPASRLYADLGINGGDFLEFVVEVERRYGVDLSWVSPRDPRAEAHDPTLQSLADDVVRQRA
jgi:hypothetical protein